VRKDAEDSDGNGHGDDEAIGEEYFSVPLRRGEGSKDGRIGQRGGRERMVPGNFNRGWEQAGGRDSAKASDTVARPSARDDGRGAGNEDDKGVRSPWPASKATN
jgi:hypothetical protein